MCSVIGYLNLDIETYLLSVSPPPHVCKILCSNKNSPLSFISSPQNSNQMKTMIKGFSSEGLGYAGQRVHANLSARFNGNVRKNASNLLDLCQILFRTTTMFG